MTLNGTASVVQANISRVCRSVNLGVEHEPRRKSIMAKENSRGI
jgi:hypothetical protein